MSKVFYVARRLNTFVPMVHRDWGYSLYYVDAYKDRGFTYADRVSRASRFESLASREFRRLNQDDWEIIEIDGDDVFGAGAVTRFTPIRAFTTKGELKEVDDIENYLKIIKD
ncbi:MAG: hypothetical protein KAS32_17525 [Candidatus Peribacteraceae bacterium]|nr:hypothetical protein [Candidatus Peribacteraceae bacterium]